MIVICETITELIVYSTNEVITRSLPLLINKLSESSDFSAGSGVKGAL